MNFHDPFNSARFVTFQIRRAAVIVSQPWRKLARTDSTMLQLKLWKTSNPCKDLQLFYFSITVSLYRQDSSSFVLYHSENSTRSFLLQLEVLMAEHRHLGHHFGSKPSSRDMTESGEKCSVLKATNNRTAAQWKQKSAQIFSTRGIKVKRIRLTVC